MQNSEDLGSVEQNELVSFFNWSLSPRRGHPTAEKTLSCLQRKCIACGLTFPPSSPGKRTCLTERSLFILGSQVSKKGRREGKEERREEERTQRNKEQERNNDRQIQRIGGDA